MSVAKKLLTPLLLSMLLTAAEGAQVWKSTFDSTADGVVNIKDRDTSKAMIGPVTSGRLQITTRDKNNAQGNNDRAGRPLGATLNGNNSFSGLYKFRWSSLDTDTRDMWEGFGFSGSDACVTNCFCNPNVCNITRQVCGALIRHRSDGAGGNILRIGIQFGESGNGNHFYKGSATELNVSANQDYYFAVGLDGASHVLSVAFFDASGILLDSVSQDLDDATAGLLPSVTSSVGAMLSALAVTHLGWNDYSTNLPTPDRTTVWQVDELTYFNDAAGAFNAVVSQQTGACCAPAGTCLDGQSQAACTAIGGLSWPGAGSLCANITCPDPIGACCHPDGSCSQETSASCAAAGGAWQGANTACTLTSCPQPPTGACCSDVDGSCTDGKTQYNCAGVWQGANTTCAGTNCPPPSGGACCLPNGACIDTSTGGCAAQCGTFQGAGSSCASAACPQDAPGACCLPDGSCSQTLEWQCTGAWRGAGTTCAAAGCQPMPSLVWWSNFHSGKDGLENVRDNNPTKELIGAQCDGRVKVTTRSRPNNWEVNDRGGKPLGTTVTGNDSFSGLYRFRWSALNEGTTQAIEFPAFLGDRTNCTEQLFGCILSHNKVGNDYYVRMCSAAGEALYYFLFQCGATFNLGPDAPTRDYQLAISYDATTHLLSHAIFDDQGVLLGTEETRSFQSWDMDIVCPGGPCQNYFDCVVEDPPCSKETKYNRTALTHLGWSEYTSFDGSTHDTVWDVDSLAYFNTAAGAFNAVYGDVPRGACCRADGTCAENDTEQACLASGGSWSGAGATCATTICSGACCLPTAECLDSQTVAQCAAAGGAFQGLNSTCAQTSCPLPPCKVPFADVDDDDDVDMDDFAVFQTCFTGPVGPLVQPGICHCFDRDNGGQGDQDVDGDDFVQFKNCVSGPAIPVNQACGG